MASDVKPLKRKEPRYTPLSKRQDRPDAIAWLLRNHPELSEMQICKLLGTTKATVQAVRERTHWKSQEIRPRDPVLLGLCAQLELDDAVLRAKIDSGKQAAARDRPRSRSMPTCRPTTTSSASEPRRRPAARGDRASSAPTAAGGRSRSARRCGAGRRPRRWAGCRG